jgi:N-acetylglucosaminyl-diphospho-decaprenol L-rhamnosyltransferase
MPLEVGAVIVHYGPWAVTSRAVASFRRHVPDVRLVVVDNGRGEPSAGLGEVGAEVIQAPRNLGFGAACNLGAKALATPLLLLANNDVELFDDSVHTLRRAVESDARIAAAGPAFTDAERRLRPSFRRPPSPWRIFCESVLLAKIFPLVPWFAGHHTARGPRRVSRDAETLLGALFLIRREAFEEVGGFDESYFFYAEETDLFARLRGRGWRIVFEPRARVIHGEGVASQSVPQERLDEWLHDGLRRYARRFHGEAGERRTLRFLRAGARIRWLLSYLPGMPGRHARRTRYAAILRFHERWARPDDLSGTGKASGGR